MYATAANERSTFHVREDVAPLKPRDQRHADRRPLPFHVREDVAPLKPHKIGSTERKIISFHVREDVAPLKLFSLYEFLFKQSAFPRS